MSPSATPATPTASATMASTGNQPRHQSQTSTVSATSAKQSEGTCLEVPRLPRKVEVDVAKCHTCEAKWRSMSPKASVTTASTANQARHQMHPSAMRAPPATQRRSLSPSATPATQIEAPCRQVPRLPVSVWTSWV